MPTYVAFLRAINLGSARKFPKDAIREAVESTGATGVETYINTGNVRLSLPLRSRAKVEATLEAAFVAARGFEVPTMAFTPAELAEIAADCDELAAELVEQGVPEFRQYVSLLKEPASAAAVRAMEALEHEGEAARVRGRAVHIALHRVDAYHAAQISNVTVEKMIGVATNRNANVIRELARRWGGAAGS